MNASQYEYAAAVQILESLVALPSIPRSSDMSACVYEKVMQIILKRFKRMTFRANNYDETLSFLHYQDKDSFLNIEIEPRYFDSEFLGYEASYNFVAAIKAASSALSDSDGIDYDSDLTELCFVEEEFEDFESSTGSSLLHMSDFSASEILSQIDSISSLSTDEQTEISKYISAIQSLCQRYTELDTMYMLTKFISSIPQRGSYETGMCEMQYLPFLTAAKSPSLRAYFTSCLPPSLKWIDQFFPDCGVVLYGPDCSNCNGIILPTQDGLWYQQIFYVLSYDTQNEDLIHNSDLCVDLLYRICLEACFLLYQADAQQYPLLETELQLQLERIKKHVAKSDQKYGENLHEYI